MSMFHELMMRKKEQIMYATIKGSPTESPEGVFSGFSANNYLKTSNNIIINQSSDFEIVVKINISVFADLSAFIGTYGYYGIVVRTGVDYKFHCSIGNGSSWLVSNLATNSTFSVNTDYFFKLTIKNGVITIFSSLDGNSWIEEGTTTVTLSEINTPINLGIGRINTTYFNGSIDLNNSYIKLGSTKYKLQAVVGYTIVGSPTIVDGVVSGFSGSDYVHILNFPTIYDSIEFVTKVKNNLTSASSSNSVFALGNGSVSQNKFYLYFNTQQVIFRYRSTDNTTKNLTVNYVSSANTFYYIRVRIYTNKIILGISTDKINWLEGEVADSIIMAPSMDLRYGIISNNPWALDGSIDLNETDIKINNKLWFNGQQA